MHREGGEKQWVIRGDGNSQHDSLVSHLLMLARAALLVVVDYCECHSEFCGFVNANPQSDSCCPQRQAPIDMPEAEVVAPPESAIGA
jgi:hypothetical protein